MPTSTSITTTYAGEFAKQYIAATILASKTVENVTQHLNINGKYVVKKGANEADFANLTCDFTPTGTVTLTELILDPKQLQWQTRLCKKDFLADWEAMQMGFGNNRNLPPLFGDWILDHQAAKAAAKIEQLMWVGEATNAGEFDGFYTQFSAIDVNGTSITASNVIAEIGKVIDAIPTAVYAYRNEDLFIYAPTQVIRAYVRAQNALGYLDLYHAGYTELVVDGVKLIECPGMSDNTMVAARKSNLHFATGLLGDMTDVKLLDKSNIDLSENVDLSIKFSADTGIGFESDAVYYAVPAS